MRIRTITAAAAVATLSTVGFVGAAAAAEGPANDNARSCVLSNQTEYSSVGHMMQHLRDRTDGKVAGTPKDVVDGYSQYFDSVGDLVDQKCGL
jgi:hypothetical protein